LQFPSFLSPRLSAAADFDLDRSREIVPAARADSRQLNGTFIFCFFGPVASHVADRSGDNLRQRTERP